VITEKGDCVSPPVGHKAEEMRNEVRRRPELALPHGGIVIDA
jgi:hypothetical protein